MAPTCPDSSRNFLPAAHAHDGLASTTLCLWAKDFDEANAGGATADLTFLFYEMEVFFLNLLVRYDYACGNGIFRYDREDSKESGITR